MTTKIVPKEGLSLEEGKHQGVIVDVQTRDIPYEYVDFTIGYIDGRKEKEPILRYGLPLNPSMNSKLMKFLSLFQKIEPEKEIDIEKIVLKKKVEFMTMNEDTDKGTFTRVISDSVKPLKE